MKIICYVKALIVLIGLTIFYGLFTLILPFMVQERLVLVLTIIIIVRTVFNGTIYSTEKVKFKIMFKNKEN